MAKLLKKLTHNDGGATFVRQKQFTEGTLRYSLYKQTQVTKLFSILKPNSPSLNGETVFFHLNSMKIVQVVVIYGVLKLH